MTDPLILDSCDIQFAAEARTWGRNGGRDLSSDYTGRRREIWTVFFQAAVERRNRRVTQ